MCAASNLIQRVGSIWHLALQVGLMEAYINQNLFLTCFKPQVKFGFYHIRPSDRVFSLLSFSLLRPLRALLRFAEAQNAGLCLQRT